MRVLALCLLVACVDSQPVEPEEDDITQEVATGCKKMIHVTLRTNYGIEAFDPTREVPNRCWNDADPVENINSSTWRRCGAMGCEPTLDKLHWYYDDTSMFTTAQDQADILRVHSGMGEIKGTVDMANRGDGWNYFQMDAGVDHDIIDRWFAETHAAVGDHAGCQFQENDYIDDWLAFRRAKGDERIRPQLVVISADHRCPVDDRPLENCPAAYTQVKHACALIGSGRTLAITAEGGLKLQYGHCLGDVIKAINDCTCERQGGCS